MEWVSPQHSRGEVDRAGAILAANNPDVVDLEHSYPIINNWRSSHSRPLYTFRLGLRSYAEKVDSNALVAQRIKRLSSIRLKLMLLPQMKLSQMQGIGGCRAVVSSVSDIYKVVKSYKTSDIKHKLLSEDDYIKNPKTSG
jgi:(p)ppGpp synthase/HD superfamily hydrolase